MEFKFLPSLFGSRRRDGTGSAVAHAISGSTGAMSGAYGSVFSSTSGGWDVDRAVQEGLEKVIWVFRCVDAIASNQAKLPIIMREEDPVDGRVYKDPRIFKLLNRRTNIHETAQDFRYRLSAQLLLSKRGAFIEVVKDAYGRVKALELLPPGSTEPIPDPETFVSGYRLTSFDQYNTRETILPKERVIWIRIKPHPTDPYLQLTPLTAAGLAVDTDWLARLYNRNFLLNDGKPGLLIAVAGQLNKTDSEELKARFRGGPQGAGRTSVIEADDMNVVDLGASPRDMQWLEAIRGSKDDILLAFGTPESVLGNASGRTYDNADAELEVWWSETMVPHCDPIGRGLEPLSGSTEDDRYICYDYDGVDVLQRHKRERHAKKLEEFKAGLCTIDDYFKETGKKPWGVPGTSVLILGNGMVIGPDDEIEQRAAQTPIIQAQAALQGQGGGAEIHAYNGAMKGVEAGQRNFENIIAARARQYALTGSTKAIEAKVVQRKSYDYVDDDALEGELVENVREVYSEKVAAELTGIIGAWSDMQDDIITGRLMHVKCRQFTRHWEGKQFEDKKLDQNYAVDIDRWIAQLKESTSKAMLRAVMEEFRRAANDMVQTGVANAMHARGRGNPKGRSAVAKVFGSTTNAEQAARELITPVETVVEAAARRQSAKVAQRIREMDDQGASMTDIKAEVRRLIGSRSSWRAGLGDFIGKALVEGAWSTAYDKAGRLMTKTWNTVEDERVRHSHMAVNGVEKGINKKFKVGKSWMSYPGDPRGGIEEVINCRCWLDYNVAEDQGAFFDEHAG